jgi:hypothetical protein
MYNVTRLLDVAENDRERVLAEVRTAAADTGAHRRIVEPTLSGSRNGGDILVHLRFDAEHEWRSTAESFMPAITHPAITRVNGVCYSGEGTRSNPAGATVYRTLLLRVAPATEADIVARFEDELRAMPRYVKTIVAWQLSRVEEAVGASDWTHAFEQEFTDVDGLMGPYLMHPIHWAVVDRWFDPECPDVIIRDRVCHSFCRSEHSVLG